MSIKVMEWVWEHSPAKGSGLLVLLAIADHANADGTGAWPSLESLSSKTRLSERSVRYILRDLEGLGCITTECQQGPFGTNAYTVQLEGAKIAGGNPAPEGGQPSAERGATHCPQTVLEPSLEPTTTTAKGAGLIFALYERHIGTIDPWIAARLTEAEAEYSEECLAHSFAEASRQNVRRWAYVEAILKAHKEEGCYVRRSKANGRGHAGAGAKHTIRAPDLDEWREYAAAGQGGPADPAE
ncbi:hypothetical protein LCGC14_2413960 [marine sediment metagenome]|uniref:Helix-turn-helix domain-containing protein n=1 Tax=marine sediment metagenome TaxID=412755 RepID=A0A0F9BRP6_9ZZZZ